MFAKTSYDDSSRDNFYTLVGAAFKKLAEEEITAAEQAGEDAPYYPDFGNSKSTHEDWVKQFYAVWSGFRTLKSFSWCDLYRYSDAPDRRIKRIMEKENKKFRDTGIREFNDSVRVGLVIPVSFVPELIEEVVLRFLCTETRPPVH